MPFYHKHKTDHSAIFLLHQCTDGRLKYYTGESGKPGSLSRGTQAVLNRITDAVEAVADKAKVSGQPLTKAALRALLDRLLNRGTPEWFPGVFYF